MLVLDSGGVSRLSQRRPGAAALISVLQRDGWWPPIVPNVVLVEATSGRPGRDANVNRFLKTCDLISDLPEPIARRAAALRARAGRGSAVDAIVVALAEPFGAVLTGDLQDLSALAGHAEGVIVLRA